MTERASACTEDMFLGGQLRLRQLKTGHRAGHDAMLLAAATPAQRSDRVVDFGAGVGAAGLAVARRDRPLAPSNRSVAGAQRRLGSTAATQVEIAVAPGQAAAMNSVLKR